MGVIEMEGTRFNDDCVKLNVKGERVEVKVKGNELVINTYLLWFAEVLLIA
jgi:hypothetical protein